MAVYLAAADWDTPPMGWNSWDLYGCDVTEDKIKAMADAMVDKDLFAKGANVSLLDLGF